MNDQPKTFSHDELAAVTGAGEVIYNLQNYFKANKLYNMRKYGFGEVRTGSQGLDTPNPNTTPDVIRFPGSGG